MKGFHTIHPETGLEVYVIPETEVTERDAKVTRLEIINHYDTKDKRIGRLLTLYKELDDFENVELSYQDGGRTLKIFLT